MLRYKVTERGRDYVTLELQGELTGEVPVEQLHETLKEHYVDDGVRLIQVNLAGVELIDLEGIGVLLALLRESNRRDKRFVAEDARGSVRSKLVTAGVLALLEQGN